MKYAKCILVLCLTAISMYCTAFASTSLYVQDPRSTWRYERASIDQAVISVNPVGAYFEIGLYLTFSAKTTQMTKPSDTLEVQFFFDLPANSHLIDSWLWVEDTIVKAMLIERGQAQLIYEGIVKRRRDPSVIYKNSATSYEMRVFPLAGNQSRKVKITYLVPANWSQSSVSSYLPTGFMQLSKVPLSTINIFAFPDEKWKNPSLPELQTSTFMPSKDSLFPNYVYTTVQPIPRELSLAFDSPLVDGTYLSVFESGATGGYYQLVVLPKLAFNFYQPKKVLFLIDYDAAKTGLSRDEVLTHLNTAFKNNLNPLDSFNILLSGQGGNPGDQGWISGTLFNETFAKIKSTDLSIFSQLPTLLTQGVKFLSNNGKDGMLVVISPSDALGSNKVANPYIEELNKIIDFPIQFNIADYCDQNKQNYSFGNKTFYGNEYLYDYLASSSGGNYLEINDFSRSLVTLINSLMNKLDGDIQSLELYTTAQNGFCYGRYYLDNSYQPSYSNSAVYQFGKYEGELPFQIKATGFYRNKAFSKDIVIPMSQADVHDKIDKRIWTAQYIKSLENGNPSNEIIKEIILASKQNRVLSKYTAFLALEPYLMPKDEEDNGGPNDVADDVSINDFAELSAYPNPFSDKVRISIKLKDISELKIIKIEVINLLGQSVKSFAVDNSQNFDIYWDGTSNSGDQADKGVYFFVLTTNSGKLVYKIVKV